MANSFTNITKSTGKIYISLIMASLMSLLEILMHDIYHLYFSWNYYLVFIIIIALIILLYKKQYFIDDKNYLNEMIEHHSMAILTSGEIINKTKDDKVKTFANNIIKTQEKEIEQMKQMLVKEEKQIITVEDIENNKKI